MSKTKITAPVEGFTGTGVGGLEFKSGVAWTDDEALINYCTGAGYGIGNSNPLRPVADEPADPRDIDTTKVGAPLRDAAVDPRAEDFLPPTNAGKANPHGPEVVAPGIHGLETKVVLPGAVPDDPAQQQAKETDFADKALVQNLDLGLAVPGFTRSQDPDEQTHPDDGSGPLGLSDPGSTGAAGDSGDDDVEGDGYDPSTGTVEQVNAYLDEHPDEAAAVLEAEAAGKNRQGILQGPHSSQLQS